MHVNEHIEAFLVRLRTLASTCQYGALCEELIRDCIMCGLWDDAVHKMLLQKVDLTLSTCVDTVKASEATASQMKSMSNLNFKVLGLRARYIHRIYSVDRLWCSTSAHRYPHTKFINVAHTEL